MTVKISPSEQALLDLWDLIDQTRISQGETHAAIVARRAYEAAARPPKESTTMATKEMRLKTAEIFLELDPDGQRQIIAAAARSRDEAYAVAMRLINNQPAPAETVKDARQPSRSDMFGALLDGAAASQAATVQRSKAIIAAHQGEDPDHRWWK